jgi:Mn2+/Fe2+ NRAMP family transporter
MKIGVWMIGVGLLVCIAAVMLGVVAVYTPVPQGPENLQGVANVVGGFVASIVLILLGLLLVAVGVGIVIGAAWKRSQRKPPIGLQQP